MLTKKQKSLQIFYISWTDLEHFEKQSKIF